MERDVMQKLIAWRESAERKPLILKGARQVGKTYILKDFGRRCFNNTVYINCDNDPTAANIISRDYDVQRVLLELSAYTHTHITPGDTLIILDEVQQTPKGLHLLKYFCEEARDYHVAVAGSMLGITLHQGESFPVGKVDIIDMYPMSFLEFLCAMGHEEYAEMIRRHAWTEVNDLLPHISWLLRQYYFVGGMPEVVQAWVDKSSPESIRDKQKLLLMSYENDVSKHAPIKDVPRIHQVWLSIPSQLAKENRKFVYSAIRKGARAAEFEVAIQWIVDAGLVYKVNRLDKVAMPLGFYTDFNAFKLYVLDCGLLGAMCNAPAEMMLVGDKAFVEFKGAFTEQYVMQQLICDAYDSICYYTNDAGTQEIDFVVQKGSAIVPLEVKAEVNVKAKSFKAFLDAHPQLQGVRLSMLPYQPQSRFINLPLCCAPSL